MSHDLALEARNLGKRFGNQWVLSGLNLSLRIGEAVALFGGNGSGKSTFLKMSATLLNPSCGQIFVLDRDATQERDAIRRKIRFLAHERQLYGTLTVDENLRLAAKIRGLNGDKTRAQLEEAVERLGLKTFRHRRVAQLSEGMKKRTAVARLLLGPEEPEIILLDEPHPTLDQQGKKVLDDLIGEWRKKGKTVLIASHDHALTKAHVDRLIILTEGRISYDGIVK